MDVLSVLVSFSNKFIWVTINVPDKFIRENASKFPYDIPWSIQEICYGALCSNIPFDHIDQFNLISMWEGAPPQNLTEKDFVEKYVRNVYFLDRARSFYRDGCKFEKIKSCATLA